MSVAKSKSPQETRDILKERKEKFWSRGSENILLGSCPVCGVNIWSNDFHTAIGQDAIFKCVSCRDLIGIDEIIPF